MEQSAGTPESGPPTTELELPLARAPEIAPEPIPAACYQILFIQSSDGLALVDQDLRVAKVNSAFESLTGFPARELVGRRCVELVLPAEASATDSSAAGLTDWGEAIRLGQSVIDRPAKLRISDGERTAVRLSIAPILFVGAHAPLSLLSVRPLAGSTGNDRLPTDLMSAVSHELRTPLTSLKGCASMLLHYREGLDEERVRDLLRIIDEQADRMRESIDNLADLTKIETGGLRIRRRPFPWSLLVEEVLETARGRGIVVVAPPSVAPAALDVDPRRVEQALRSMVEAFGEGASSGQPVTIDAEPRDEGLIISIGRHGSRPFGSAGHSGGGASTASRRAALQLRFCRAIVAAHGGQFRVENVGDQGEVARFTLPLAAQQTLPASPPLPTLSPSAVGPAPLARPSGKGHRPRVLVVDNDRRFVKLVRATLEAEDLDVHAVYDGLSVLEMVAAARHDLIVLDLVLEETDGFELCKRIREFTTAPIIILTAKGGGADKVRALDLGADDYLTKPFETAELVARVRAALRRANLGGECESHPSFASRELQVDFSSRAVSMRGRPVSLSPTEYRLLYHLVTNAGRVLVHEDLLSKVWGPAYRSEVGYLRSYIKHLRNKLEDKPSEPRFILTQPGVGYFFRALS